MNNSYKYLQPQAESQNYKQQFPLISVYHQIVLNDARTLQHAEHCTIYPNQAIIAVWMLYPPSPFAGLEKRKIHLFYHFVTLNAFMCLPHTMA